MPRRFRVATAAVAGTVLIGACSPFGGVGRPAPMRAVYVDCGAAAAGDGSIVHPFDSLALANAHVLAPGERLLLRRGSECTGTLAPQGSGTAHQPVVIGAYGSGPMPRVTAAGEDAVLLANVSHVVVGDLDVTNPGTTPARRRGVHLLADGAVVRDVTVRDLWVHDVAGDLHKDSGGSGGIQVDAVGSTVRGRFDGVQILDNRIEHVARSGIFVVGSAGGTRPRAGAPWPDASTHVVVRGNRLAHLAGDGIVPTGTDGAVVEHNVVVDGNAAATPWNGPSPVCNAGIWAFNANATLIQYNEVSHMQFNGCDGTGFDVDYDQDRTTVQYNYSHDNAGGFILLCTDANPRAAEVRYNLSVDDAATLSDAPCAIGSGNIGSLDAVRFFDNTIVSARPVATLEDIPVTTLFSPGNFVFANNVVVATGAGGDPLACGDRCTNNLYFGLPPSGTSAVTGDPRFVDATRRIAGRLAEGAAFRVRRGSPAIGAGVALPGAPMYDYFGTRVPTATAPTVGFAQAWPPRAR
jgi:hypothetical protein